MIESSSGIANGNHIQTILNRATGDKIRNSLKD